VSARLRSSLPAWRRLRGLAFAAIGLAILSAFAALAANAPLPAKWKHWRYSRAIELTMPESAIGTTTAAGQLASVAAPPDLYAHARTGLVDLRLIDDQGAEIPYVIVQRIGSSKSAAKPTTLRENSFSAGAYTQLVLDAGPHATFHNTVRIETNEADFIEWVRVDASDDGHVWRMVQERAPIFRFRKEAREGTQVVHFSENNAQYLRVRILDGDKIFPVSGAQFLYETTEQAERVPLGIALSADANSTPGRSSWSAELGAALPLVTEVGFDVTAPPEFSRSVDVSLSADGKDWLYPQSAEIYRYRQGDAQQEQLTMDINPTWGPVTRFRVQIVNGNDAPLDVAAPKLYITPQRVVFEPQAGRSYRLIYGQERAERAEYDLHKRVNQTRLAALVNGRLGPEEVNSNWVDPRPWTETHDIFLWLVLLAAVLLMGYAAVRSLRKSAAAPEA
jgi:hypothetical protein